MDQPHPDPFAALGLEPAFDLDRAQIERAYLSRTAQTHPDLNQGQPDASASLNDARQTLLNPETRANALLAHLGGPNASQHKALPEGFLADIMHTRLEIEEAIESNDPAQLDPWRTWAADQRAAYTTKVQAAFTQATKTNPPQETLADIRETLNAWRYIERLIEQLPPA